MQDGPPTEHTVIIGLGNRFLHDDAVGLAVVDKLGEMKDSDEPALEDATIDAYEEMDLSLLQQMKHASRLIIIDSMKSGEAPGTVSIFRVAEGKGGIDSLPSLHELELSEMIKLAKDIGVISCPVEIVGVEPADLTLGEGLSEQVRAAVPKAVRLVVAQLSGDARGTA